MAATENITTYRWSEPSLIRRIDVRSQSNGWAVAYLYADPDPARNAKRMDVRAAIRLKGWGTLSDHRNNEFGLRVTGLRDGNDLIRMLQDQGFVGAPQSESMQKGQEEAPKTVREKIGANSLRYSGIIATVGNAVGIARGVHNRLVAARLKGTDARQWGEIGKGLAFAAADLPLAIAGERDDSRQLTDFLKQLKKFYVQNGIEIPGTASIHVETSSRGKGLGERSMDFMHRYANQIKCGFEVVAAFLSIKAGHEQELWPKRVAPWFWGSGFLASGLISERKIDPERYAEAGTLGRLWMKIQSNPLVLGGTLGWTNNAADYYSAKIGRDRWIKGGRNGPPLHLWDVATPTTMLGANGLYAISKKTVGGDIKNQAMVDDAYTVAAQIINKQPEALREKAIESTAKFFAERTEIKEHHAEAIVRLRQEVELQRQNPWFEPLGLAPYVPQVRRVGRDASDAAAAAGTMPVAEGPRTVVHALNLERVASAQAAPNATLG